MIRKSYDIETESEHLRICSDDGVSIHLAAGGSVELTPSEAREVAQCLMAVADEIDPQSSMTFSPVTPPMAPNRAPHRDLLSYGDGGKLNPQ